MHTCLDLQSTGGPPRISVHVISLKQPNALKLATTMKPVTIGVLLMNSNVGTSSEK